MDLQTLSNLFASTINPDPNVRKAGELQIRKVGNEEGMITALLQIIATDSVDLATRQACTVWLKNRVFSYYSIDSTADRRADLGFIANSDREALRTNILRLLANSPSRSISLQLANALKNIVAHDFPERWPSFIQEVKNLLNSSNVHEVHAGCIAALEGIRAFRFRNRSSPIPQLVSELFPTLVNIATQMLQTPPSAATEIPTMLHLILKTYKTSILVDLSTHQQSEASLVPWGKLFFAVVNLQIPPEAVPADEEERETSEWWKAKKWAYGTLGRLFHKFGNPSQLPSAHQAQYGAFAAHFVAQFAPEILRIYLHQVELYVSNQAWISKKCQYQIFTFFTECIKPKSTWALLKPSFETLVSSFVFPQLSFNEAKKALWESDPIDYVRVAVDEYESFATPVSAATSFLFSLASNRTKSTFMPILGFINTVLRAGSPAPQRFGALNMTAALAPWMMRHPDVKGNMEGFVMQFVTPEFSSPEPYLRAINLSANFRAVAAALDDPELPVRVNAALAITELVTTEESVRVAVGPQVGKVIQEQHALVDLLKLSDETDLDLLNRSMEIMVEAFQTELVPVAAQLTSRLVESYLRLAKEALALEDTDGNANLDAIADMDDDKTFNAMGVAKTISTIISSIDASPEILAQVQEVLLPMIQFTLEKKLLDLFDNMYDLVDSLTFKLRSIAPNMWPIFELTYKLFKSDAIDFLDDFAEMLPSLDNIVSYGSETIKAQPEYKRMLVDIYTTSMTSDQLGENDRVNGSKLIESVLLNLRGSVDDFLQIIINTALAQLEKSQTASLRLANLNVLINAVLYNPSAALHLMESAGKGRAFFDRWFAAINNNGTLPRVHDKKLSIVALSSLLELAPTAVPQSLQSGWPGIVGGILTIFKDLPKAVADRKALEDSLAEDSDEEEYVDEKILNFNEEEEDVWDEDSAYLEVLANEGARLRAKQDRAAEGEEDSDSEDEEIEEELGYISPLDTVDPYGSFKQALTTFQMQNGPSYQAATTALNVEQQTLLMEVMRLAEVNSSAAAQA
ncbi:hypothetical protein H0H92_014757 [Tricholoma furcatifolium]|nr:hypothetical protein H0H92_014757 [Tricholoma furcatifolium]